MRDDAAGHADLADRHLPLVGRGLQQHQARGRAAAADVVVRGADAAAAARRHLAPDALAREVLAGRDRLGRDFLPVALELLGDELGEAGARALPHLRARDANHTGVIGLDEHPGVDFDAVAGSLGFGGRSERQADAEDQATARDRRTDDEAAARKILVHVTPAFCRRPRAPPPGSADRCRNGRRSTSRRRSPRRSASASSSAAPPRP